jgi:hypothetical protein
MSENSNKEFVQAYFIPIEGNTSHARCVACDQVVAKGNGLTNRLNHIKINHVYIYGWMSLIIDGNLPLTCVESPAYHTAIKFRNISAKTLIKYLRLTKENVTKNLAKELPDKFGLIIDGWRENGTYFLAVFANWCQPINTNSIITNTTRIDLLGIYKLANPSNQIESINKILENHNRGFINITFITLSHGNFDGFDGLIQLNKPILLCANYRLNLGIQKLLKNDIIIQIIIKIQIIMKIIVSPKIILILKQFTYLNPVHNDDTNWLSTYYMIKRYIQFHQIIIDHYNELNLNTSLLLTNEEYIELNNFFKCLNEINEANSVLQSENFTILRMRTIFDYLIQKYPDLNEYLGNDTNINNDIDFENGLIHVMKNKKDILTNTSLTVRQADKISIFKINNLHSTTTINNINNNNNNGNEIYLTIEERAVLAAKRFKNYNSSKDTANEYMDLDWIQCTSNCIDRIFLTYKYDHIDEYIKTLPFKSVELILYLKLNRNKWCLNDLIPIILAHTNEDDEDENIDNY